jgi:hypothetical protein
MWLHCTCCHLLQGLGPLVCSDPRVSQIDPSNSLMVGLSPFFLLGGNQIASKEFSQLALLRYVNNTHSYVAILFFFHVHWIYSFLFLSNISIYYWFILLWEPPTVPNRRSQLLQYHCQTDNLNSRRDHKFNIYLYCMPDKEVVSHQCKH